MTKGLVSFVISFCRWLAWSDPGVVRSVVYVDILTTKPISVILLNNHKARFQGTGGSSTHVLDSPFVSRRYDLKGEEHARNFS